MIRSQYDLIQETQGMRLGLSDTCGFGILDCQATLATQRQLWSLHLAQPHQDFEGFQSSLTNAAE